MSHLHECDAFLNHVLRLDPAVKESLYKIVLRAGITRQKALLYRVAGEP